MTDLLKAKEMLINKGYTCVILKNDITYTSKSRGIKPLVQWYSQNYDFTGFSAADKVIGKATAFLYILLNIKSVYATIISRTALELLTQNKVFVEYSSISDYIINRTKDGVCPFESAVLNINDKNKAYQAIGNKMEEMGITI